MDSITIRIGVEAPTIHIATDQAHLEDLPQVLTQQGSQPGTIQLPELPKIQPIHLCTHDHLRQFRPQHTGGTDHGKPPITQTQATPAPTNVISSNPPATASTNDFSMESILPAIQSLDVPKPVKDFLTALAKIVAPLLKGSGAANTPAGTTQNAVTANDAPAQSSPGTSQVSPGATSPVASSGTSPTTSSPGSPSSSAVRNASYTNDSPAKPVSGSSQAPANATPPSSSDHPSPEPSPVSGASGSTPTRVIQNASYSGGSSGLHNAAAMRIGPAGSVAALKDMSGQVGRDLYALDFLDMNDPAGGDKAIGNPGWLLNTYSAWKKEDPDRRLILSVPMLQSSERGKLADGANGAFDTRFRELAKNMEASGLGDSVIRLGWEANGDWFPWSAQSDPEAYKAYFQRIVTIMREEAPNLKFDFCINHGWTEGGKTSLANLYPGDKYVDIIGMDPYDGLSSSDPDPKVRWKQIYEGVDGVNGLADIKQFAHEHGKQVSLPEWGLTTKTGKNDNAYFIDQISNFTKDKDVDLAYQSYFDSPADLGTSLEQNPNAFEAYKRDFGGQTVNT